MSKREYLTKENIILINQKTVKKHGGQFIPPSNFLKEESLDYLIDAVQTEMFGEPLYPTPFDKAGLMLFSIINNHIFQDGNKRTGLGAALLFLRLNGFQLKDNIAKISTEKGNSIPTLGDTTTEILIEFILEVASAKVSLEECQEWLLQNTVKLKQ